MKRLKRKSEVKTGAQKLKKQKLSCVSKNKKSDAQEPGASSSFDDEVVIENQDKELNNTAFSDDDSDQIQESDDESVDPFMKHFKNSLHPNLLKTLESSSPKIFREQAIWPVLRSVNISIPSCPEPESINIPKKLLDDEITYTTGGSPPKIPNLKEATAEDMHIKSQIAKNLIKANCALNESLDEKRFMTEFQNELFAIVSNYQDLYYTKETLTNNDSIRFVYCLHMANHVLKSRTKVLRHNIKMKNKGDDDVPDEFRDQGFVRPKVLVLLPFRSSAYKVISVLEKLLFGEGKKGSVMNKKRFEEEYKEETQKIPMRKPEEYKTIFSGNTDEDFTMGISVTNKALKLYSEFYSSDIIIASPLGLRRIIGAQGDAERDYDFLSSIELTILDQTDIFLMQNWLHIGHIVNHLHLKLKDHRRTDFSRVRLWSIDGHAKFYRQTLMFVSVRLHLIKSLFIKHCHNYAGNVVVEKSFGSGTIDNIYGDRQHNFYKFSFETPLEIPTKRFERFVNDVLPIFRKNETLRHVLIYIPCYYDFVKLRNYFMKECVDFLQICEHSPGGKVAETRDIFFNRDVHFLLYTERFHFYNRISLKGIRHIIFYETPTYPHYYSEICNMMNNNNLKKSKWCYTNFSISVIYSPGEMTQLAPIVGSKKAREMVLSERNEHQLFTDYN